MQEEKVWVESSKRREYSPHTPQPTLPHKCVTLGKLCFNFKLEAFDNNADADEAIEADANGVDEANKADVAENNYNKAYLIIVANKVEEANETSVAGAADVEVAIATNKANVANKAIEANEANEVNEANELDKLDVARDTNVTNKANTKEAIMAADPDVADKANEADKAIEIHFADLADEAIVADEANEILAAD